MELFEQTCRRFSKATKKLFSNRCFYRTIDPIPWYSTLAGLVEYDMQHIAAISAEVFRKLLHIVDGGECVPRKDRDTTDISAYGVYYSMKGGALTAEDIEMPLTGNIERRLLIVHQGTGSLSFFKNECMCSVLLQEKQGGS